MKSLRYNLLAAVALAGCTRAPAPAPAPAPVAGAQAPANASAAADTNSPKPGPGALSAPNADPYPSTYARFASRPTFIRNVTIMTAAGPTIRNGAVLLRDGKIAAVGANISAPPDATALDGQGKYVTPGII